MLPDRTLAGRARSVDRRPRTRRAWVASVALGVLVVVTAGAGILREGPQDRPSVDGDALIAALAALSHDSMAGRRTGTDGGLRAQAFVAAQMDALGLEMLGEVRAHEFAMVGADPDAPGAANLLGMIRGTEYPTQYFVLSAHFDHLGVRGGEIFNGADDNASGTAALLALARMFLDQPPRHSIVFAAFDAEERGLQGARAFLQAPPIDTDSILSNVNLDMVSRSEVGELYAAGLAHYPRFEPVLAAVAARSSITLLRGHDTPDLPPGDDWTSASDHGAFHAEGIPFVYFGVEDHEGYHQPSDTFENVTLDFYVEAVNTIADFVTSVDAGWEELSP